MHGRAQNPVETKTPEPLAYRINDASRALGVGRTKLYELAAQGRLKLVRIGGRTLVPADSLRRLLQDPD